MLLLLPLPLLPLLLPLPLLPLLSLLLSLPLLPVYSVEITFSQHKKVAAHHISGAHTSTR